MSILSGIGQIPPIYGTGGNPNPTNAIIYEIPTTINLLTGGGQTTYFVQNLPVPAGNYLVSYNVAVECGDNTTVISAFRLAVSAPFGPQATFTQTTAIYSTTLISGTTYYVSAVGYIEVQGTTVSLAYECDQTGNTSTLTIPAYSYVSQNGLISLYPINPPPV